MHALLMQDGTRVIKVDELKRSAHGTEGGSKALACVALRKQRDSIELCGALLPSIGRYIVRYYLEHDSLWPLAQSKVRVLSSLVCVCVCVCVCASVCVRAYVGWCVLHVFF